MPDIRFGGEIHNNMMERTDGEIRDQEKMMRSLKSPQTPILKGMQVFYKLFLPHEGLAGASPAESVEILIEGENKWPTVIQNASQHQTLDWDEKHPSN